MTLPVATDAFSDDALERRRTELRKELARANTAAIVILMIVVVLAITAMMPAAKARRHASEANTQRCTRETTPARQSAPVEGRQPIAFA